VNNRELLDAFAEGLRARGSDQTETRYLRACAALVDVAGATPLAQLTRLDYQRALARLHAQGLGPRTLALTLSAWRAWLRYLAKADSAFNPALLQSIKPPKAAKRLPNALTEADAVRLVTPPPAEASTQSAELDSRDQAMFEVLYGCGIRIGELIGLDVADVDLAGRELRVFGKGRKERVVPFGEPAAAALRRWLDARAGLRAMTDGDASALFLGARGERVAAAVVRRALRQRALQQGLSTHVYPHRLRHSFASHVLQSSGDLRAVQELMGHASIASTQVYTHLDFQHLAKVYDAAHPRAHKKPAK